MAVADICWIERALATGLKGSKGTTLLAGMLLDGKGGTTYPAVPHSERVYQNGAEYQQWSTPEPISDSGSLTVQAHPKLLTAVHACVAGVVSPTGAGAAKLWEWTSCGTMLEAIVGGRHGTAAAKSKRVEKCRIHGWTLQVNNNQEAQLIFDYTGSYPLFNETNPTLTMEARATTPILTGGTVQTSIFSFTPDGGAALDLLDYVTSLTISYKVGVDEVAPDVNSGINRPIPVPKAIPQITINAQLVNCDDDVIQAIGYGTSATLPNRISPPIDSDAFQLQLLGGITGEALHYNYIDITCAAGYGPRMYCTIDPLARTGTLDLMFGTHPTIGIQSELTDFPLPT